MWTKKQLIGSNRNKIAAKPTSIDFTVHDNLIYDLIHSQNGTLATAIRELVMNAIDAGAKHCHIKLSETAFSVIDDGKGFISKAEIMQYFKTFGAPHDKDDAVHGRFRIGRGQVMAFGRVTWTSNTHKMEVDTKNNGFSFAYSDSTSLLHQGCRVDGVLYTPISEREIKNIKKEIGRLVCYVPITITFNTDNLNINAANETWHIQTEDYRIRYEKDGGVKVFSQGVYVKEFDRYNSDMRIGATVLTHKALALNMARNELSDNDPLWQTIKGNIREEVKKRAVSRRHGKNISTTTRRSLIDMFYDGELDIDEVMHVPLFKDVRGFSLSISGLLSCTLPLTIGEGDCRMAETIATRRLARVLDDVVLQEFETADLPTLLYLITEVAATHYEKRLNEIKKVRYKRIIGLETIAQTLVDDETIIPTKSLSVRDRCARNALQAGALMWAKKLAHLYDDYYKPRKLLIGKSTVADAWTNGIDTIAVSQSQLRLLDTRGQHASYYFALLLLHEYLHNNNDAASHKHDFPFMEAFHDIALDRKEDMLGSVANAIYQRYCNDLLKFSLPLPKKMLRYFTGAQVSDIQTVILHRNEKPLSKMAIKILQWLELPFERKKDRLVFSISGHTRRHTSAATVWYRQAKKIEESVVPFHAYRSIIDNAADEINVWEEKRRQEIKAYANDIGGILHQRFGDSTHTREFFVGLAACGDVDSTLRWLAKQSQLGISYAEWSIVGTRRKVVNDYVNYTHSIHYPFHEEWDYSARWKTPYRWYGLLERHAPIADYATTKEGRLAYAKNIIQHTFAGLTNQQERMEFAREMLTPSACRELKIDRVEREPNDEYCVTAQ